MWIATDNLTQLDSTVRRGRTADVDRLLTDVLFEPPARTAIPLACPTCRRDLVRQPLAIPGLFVSGCPAGHGGWLSPEVAESLRRYAMARAAAESRRRLVLLGALAIGSFAVLATFAAPRRPAAPPRPPVPAAATTLTRDNVDLTRLGDAYWPERRWPGARAIPLKESRIDRHAELAYFHQLLELLDAGISNRLNIDGALAIRRPPDWYETVYDVYRRRQTDVLERLRGLAAPASLAPIHERVVRATERQIDFYGDFARAKAQDSTTSLGRLLTHPALKEQNEALHAAWDRVRQIYVDLDPETSQAIEQHFCGFDVI
jgi:hypothetical protein